MPRPMQVVGRIAGPLLLLLGLVAGVGLLVTKVLENTFPLVNEDAVDRSLAAARTPAATALSGFFSLLGSTVAIVGVLLVMAVVFRLAFGRWRESACLVLGVSAQALIFLLATLLVARARPDVVRLDASPPTSSFPSGHTGASTALYLGIAVVLAWHTRGRWARRSTIAALVLVPLSVALARLYRGMHYPSDVLTGLLNGASCVAISARNLLSGALPASWTRYLDGARDSARQLT